MKTIVVLGMHRSGTSLVASILRQLGVDMGEDLGVPAEDNPNGHHEDQAFVKLNAAILQDAGGNWANPPKPAELRVAGHRMQPAIKALISHRTGGGRELWGWKDPRTVLTAPLYHRHLTSPHYIVVKRDRPDVVDSLIQRDGLADWDWLCEVYDRFLAAFVQDVNAPVHTIRYEDLTHPQAALMAIDKLVRFLGVDDSLAYLAQGCIEYRDRWGFGSVAIGCPYYKASYDFFRWWSWVLVGGLEQGDHLLNGPDVRCEVPIPMAHNDLVRAFLASEQDTLCMVEDDHVGPQDIIRQMRNKPENQTFDIVCASYINRRPPLTAVGFNFEGGVNEYGEYLCLVEPMKVARTGTQQYDGAALGLVLIRRWVLEKMMEGIGPEDYFWFDWRGRNSQDVQFYARVKELTGARVGVDRDNPVGHVGQHIYTMREYYDLMDNHIKKQEAQNGRTL